MRYRNVVLITIDCLRHDHFNPIYMPRTFKALRDGRTFDMAFSHGPYTSPAFVSIMTSTYPLMLGGYPRLSKYRTTIAEVLRRYGFLTCAIHHNPFLTKYYGFHRGFIYFMDFIKLERTINMAKFLLSNPEITLQSVIRKLLMGFTIAHVPANIITKYAIACLRYLVKKDRRFFLWVHYMDAHHPYNIWLPRGTTLSRIKYVNLHGHKMSPEYARDARVLYAQSIRYVDKYVARLVTFLKESDVIDETLLIVTADHGEEFFEHGGYGHLAKLYDELLHVPLLIRAPEVFEKGTDSSLIGLIDMSPTILKVLDLPPHKDFLGSPLLEGASHSYIISECGHRTGDPYRIDPKYYQFAIRTRRWKLIYKPASGEVELFDTKHDPQEIENVADEHRDLVKELIRILSRHRRMEIVVTARAKVNLLRSRLSPRAFKKDRLILPS